MRNVKKKIKVLELINSLGAGGAESLLKNFLISSAREYDFDFSVCTLYTNNFFEEEIRQSGIKIWKLNLPFKYSIITGVIKLVRIVKKEKFDIIHVHLFPSSLFIALSSFFLPKDICYLFTEHSNYNKRRHFVMFKLLDMFIYSKYKKIICISKEVRNTLVKWVPFVKNKTIVIFNGIPIPNKKGNNANKTFDILFVGRLEKQKGVRYLLEAVMLLKVKYSLLVKVGIVGDGKLKDELLLLSKKYDIERQVQFLGIRRDVSDLMNNSKIFILPSIWEGFGLVIVEAMSSGLPVIASSVGGIPEIIESGVDGILVPPSDPEALAQAVKMLLNNIGLRRTISENAYKKVKERFSIEVYVTNLFNLYKKLLEDRLLK